MKLYLFKITLAGGGNTPEEAWNDACDAFMQDSGVCPDADKYELVDEVDDE
jgi:hypothetical protein